MLVRDEFKQHDWIVNTARQNNPDNLHFHRFEDWYLWQQDQKSMEQEVKKISSVFKSLGWTNMRTMKRVASYPFHVYRWLRQIDPHLFSWRSESDKTRFYRFLQRHKEFTVR